MRNVTTFLVVGIALIGLYLAVHHARMEHEANAPAQRSGSVDHGAPTFAWSYTPVNDRDFPMTRVTLAATYPDGTSNAKDIDTVDGSCNEYYKQDSDIYQNSTMIICYAAGLGHYFKVVEKQGMYVVMRKTFEEGSPEYTPPDHPYETIATF